MDKTVVIELCYQKQGNPGRIMVRAGCTRVRPRLQRFFSTQRGRMANEYIPLLTPPDQQAEPALWFVFQRREMLVRTVTNKPELPCCTDFADHGLKPRRRQYLGTYADRTATRWKSTKHAGSMPTGLPKLPPGISISRRLIDTVAKKLAQGEPF